MDVEKTDSTKGTQSSTDTSVYGSQAVMQNGTLVFKGNLFYKGGYTDGNTASGTAEGDSIIATALSASGNNNSFDSDPLLAVKGTAGGTGINAWSADPTSGSPALSGASTLADMSFLTQTSYRGAFDGTSDWTTWTKTTTDQYFVILTSDYDGDSLTLAQEISSSYNTNPTLADTDGDGINDNTDPSPSSSTVTASGLSSASNESFVKQQYLDFLGLDADDYGLNYWLSEMSAGTKTHADVVNFFVFSDEFQNQVAPVSRLYQAYFLRIPDTQGLSYWINQKLAGVSLAEISNTFSTVDEFTNMYGPKTDEEFVQLVYQNVLGRQPDGSGLSYWVNDRLGNGDSRGTVMISFSESSEYQTTKLNNIRVIAFNYGILRRAPDSEGFGYWVAKLDAGEQPNDLINSFIDSADYQGRF